MPEISVECDRWLGIGSRYVVRIDGREVGRLGRTQKRVVCHVSVGKHSVLVAFAQQFTTPQHLELVDGESASFVLVFGSAVAAVAQVLLKPRRLRIQKPAAPAGETPLMALIRLD